jgi:hypothetical protein
MLAYPLLTWSLLGMADLTALVLCYTSFTRPMPRWCGIMAWFALPVSVGLTVLWLLLLATRLFQRLH